MLEILAEVTYFDNDILTSAYTALRMNTVSAEIPSTPERARALAYLSGLWGSVGLFILARRYDRRARRLAIQLDDPWSTSGVLQVAAVQFAATGAWRVLDTRQQRALQELDRIHAPSQVSFVLANRIVDVMIQGDHQRLRERLKQFEAHMRRFKSRSSAAYGTLGHARLRWLENDLESARRHTDRLNQEMSHNGAGHGLIRTLTATLNLQIAARRADVDTWLNLMDTHRQEIISSVSSNSYFLPAVFDSLDSALNLLEAQISLDHTQRKHIRKHINTLTLALKTTCLVAPVAKGWFLLVKGRMDLLSGHTKRAQRRLRHAQEHALRLDMPTLHASALIHEMRSYPPQSATHRATRLAAQHALIRSADQGWSQALTQPDQPSLLTSIVTTSPP